MTYYAHVVDVPVPADVYDATHAELLERTAGQLEGLLVHVARATDDGFQVLEVWTDRAAYERAEREILVPVLLEHLGAGPDAGSPPPLAAEEFAVRGLVLPGSGIAL